MSNLLTKDGMYRAALRGDAPLAKLCFGYSWNDPHTRNYVAARAPFWICAAAYYLWDSIDYNFALTPKQYWNIINLLVSAPKSRDAFAIASIYTHPLIMERIAPTPELVAFARYQPTMQGRGDQFIFKLLDWPLSQFDRTLLTATLFLKHTRLSESIVIIPDSKVKSSQDIPVWLCDHKSTVGRMVLDNAARRFQNEISLDLLRTLWHIYIEEATVGARWVSEEAHLPTDNMLWPLYIKTALSRDGKTAAQWRTMWDEKLYPYIKYQITAATE
jgi:hypothetical protein